ncbi:AMP-binding protein [Anaerovorax odorimutans]|uniref:AMP-binding protein n=1 Tax=Anaerovorax odorimutans TaxID=109327 RepID=A0ABT1RQ77_9FIRM|nr:AMP-binding protein [Anaerovorax odorimutans]MCQ4637349.1 AMP-binding protein [Anaerovorax odorimutans]
MTEELYQVREIESLKDMIRTGADLYKEAPAFLIKTQKGGKYHEVTHRKLEKDMNALGSRLVDLGLSGERIAIIGENSYEWILSYFAVVNGVGTAVPLDKELSQKEIANLVSVAGCKAIFFSSSYEKYVKDLDIPVKLKFELYRNEDVPFDEMDMASLLFEGRKLLSRGDRRYLDAEVNPKEARIMLFTSGTTGVPKAVMLSHHNIVSNIMNVSRIVQIRPDDRTLSILPIHHTFESTVDIMTVLYQGGSIAFFEGLKHVTKNMIEARASILVGVPLIFESIYAKLWKQAEKTKRVKALKAAIKLNRSLQKLGVDKRQKLFRDIYDNFGGRLRMIITGAAGIDPKVLRGFHDLGLEVAQGYGLTETAPIIAGTPDGERKYKKTGSVGKVIPQGEVKIIDANEEGIGEIVYRGPNVMLGYYGMPEETAEVMEDGWFHTGDLGFMDPEGWLYITGRKKNVIVTKTGKNIYPEELEQLVGEIRYVQECMVYGLDGVETGDGTTVAVQVRPDYDAIKEAFPGGMDDEDVYKLIKGIISEMNQKLPNYKRIRHVVIRDTEFIKTTTHKIKRQDNL